MLKKIIACIGVLAGSVLCASAVVGPAQATDSTVTFYTIDNSTSVSASSWGQVTAWCNTGDSATGSGFGLNNWSATQVRQLVPDYRGSDPNASGFSLDAYNGTAFTQTAAVYAICEHQS